MPIDEVIAKIREKIYKPFCQNGQFVDHAFAEIVTIKTHFGVIIFRSKGLAYYVESMYKV